MKAGQIHYYTSGRSKESWDIIDTDDYKFRVKKTWVESTNTWHIQFFNLSVLEHRFEVFLTHEELKRLKEIL